MAFGLFLVVLLPLLWDILAHCSSRRHILIICVHPWLRSGVDLFVMLPVN